MTEALRDIQQAYQPAPPEFGDAPEAEPTPAPAETMPREQVDLDYLAHTGLVRYLGEQ